MLPGLEFLALDSFYITYGGSCEGGPSGVRAGYKVRWHILKPLIDFQRLLEGAIKIQENETSERYRHGKKQENSLSVKELWNL